MFGSQMTFANQQQQQPPQVNLRETDTLTELCHVAEAVVPHPLNEEYRLKHVFVDIGGKGRDPSSVPILGSHEFIHAANQAQRFGDSIESSVPTVAVGFAGLKSRFDKQQAAIAQQNQLVKTMKESLDREKLSYRKHCEERLKKWDKQMRATETQLLNVFRRVEEGRMQLAAKQGKTYNVKSSLGKCADDIQVVRHASRDQDLENRVRTVEKNMLLQRPTGKKEQPRQEDPNKTERKKVLLRQSRQMMHNAKRKLEDCERDVAVMKPKQKSIKQIINSA